MSSQHYFVSASCVKLDTPTWWYARCCNATRTVNLYDAHELVEAWDRVRSFDASFISHWDPNRLLFSGKLFSQNISRNFLQDLPATIISSSSKEMHHEELCSLDRAGLEHVFTLCLDVAAKAMLKDYLVWSEYPKNQFQNFVCLCIKATLLKRKSWSQCV